MPKKSSTKKSSTRKPTKKQAEKLYREKYNLIQKINKRMRDTINRIGVLNEPVQIFQIAVSLPGRATISAYDSEGREYKLLSRSKKDIESMSLEDLRQLEAQTPEWRKTKEELTREINADLPPEKRKKPTFKELKDQASITRKIHEMFEENADLFYMLIDSTQVDDIREMTTTEIYQEVKQLSGAINAGAAFDWSAPPEEVGEAYKRRREASERLKLEAMQRSYFEE